MPPADRRTLPAFTLLARGGAAVVLAIGLAELVGWGVPIPPFGAGGTPGIAMLPNTALGFVTGALAVLLLAGHEPPPAWRRRPGLALAAACALLGGLTLAERVADVDLGLDRLLFADTVARHPWRPVGRMALNTSLGFLCCGLALLLTGARPVGRIRPAEPLAVVALLIGFLALVGYAYRAPFLYVVNAGGGMALPTAVGFFLLAQAIALVRPDQGVVSLVTGADPSGVFLRRILPAAVVVPVALGWVWMYLRERAVVQRVDGVALFVVAIVGVFVTVVLASARTVRALDRQREELLAHAEAARAEAEQANRAKAEFLATMSHELRTPLNAVIGYADLLEMGLRGALAPAQQDDVRRIKRSGQYLLGLINDTLNFARLEAGRVELTLADLPMDETLAGMEALIAPQVAARRLTYSYRPCDPTLRAHADRERLEQILVNLLTNACKFTDPGGHVTLWCERRVRSVRILVHDTGRGIPVAKLATIFEPFVQIDRHLTHESQQGVGLGLAISRDLARAMGGDLTVESAVGKGSTFILTLPRAPEAPEGEERPGREERRGEGVPVRG